MLYIGYLIILEGQSNQKKQFWKFPFLSCQGGKTAGAGCALYPLGDPPPQHPNRVKNT